MHVMDTPSECWQRWLHSLGLAERHGVEEGGQLGVAVLHRRVGLSVVITPVHEEHGVNVKGVGLHLCMAGGHHANRVRHA